MSRLKTSLSETLAATVKATIADWESGGKVKRLWDRDASLIRHRKGGAGSRRFPGSG